MKHTNSKQRHKFWLCYIFWCINGRKTDIFTRYSCKNRCHYTQSSEIWQTRTWKKNVYRHFFERILKRKIYVCQQLFQTLHHQKMYRQQQHYLKEHQILMLKQQSFFVHLQKFLLTEFENKIFEFLKTQTKIKKFVKRWENEKMLLIEQSHVIAHVKVEEEKFF